MSSVYVETTIPSYLAARPSRDLVTAAHQQITHEWWETATDRFEVYVSEAVLNEIRRGDPQYAAKRMEIVAELDVLGFTDDVASLIREYHVKLVLTGSAAADLAHFAYSVAYKYGLSGNLELSTHRQWTGHQAPHQGQPRNWSPDTRDRHSGRTYGPTL